MHRLFSVLALLALVSVASPAVGQLNLDGLQLGAAGAGAELDRPVTLTAEFVAPQINKPGVLHITASIESGWHIYSITQSKGGPLATRILLTQQADFQLAGEFAPSPKPEVHRDEKFFPGVPLEEHRGKVTWSAPIKFAAGVDPTKLSIAGKVTIQACSDIDKNCLPPTPYEFAAAYKPAVVGQYTHELSHAIIRGHVEPAVVVPGGIAKLVLSAEPAQGFHVYALADRASELGAKPTLIGLDGALALWARKPVESLKPIEKRDGKELQRYHEQTVTWTVELHIPKTALPGDVSVSGLIGYQTCKDTGCDVPRAARFETMLTVGSVTEAGHVPLVFEGAKYGEAALLAAAGPSHDAPVDYAGLAWVLGASLLGGLILNLMPCVLPVIGLKILTFVEQAGQSRAHVFALNMAYTLGLLSVFMVLATLAVTLNLGWGQQFQSTSFNIVMSAVVFVMALSFLGVWELPIPGFASSGKATDLAAQEGYWGAIAKGVLTTVLATPCSGPFLGPVFGFTLKQPPFVTYLVFAFIGLGMASPYIVIGLFPKLVKWLPKPGAWMDTFKQMMGFVLLGTIVYLFTFLNKDYVVPTFALLVGLWAGCWWIGRTPLYEETRKVVAAWGQGGAFAALIGWFAFTVLVPQISLLPWEPFTPTRLSQLTGEGRTVLVDFTADWCPTCKLNLATAVDVRDVNEYVRNHQVSTLLADWTDHSDEIKQMLETLGSKSIPVLAIFPADRPNAPIVLRDLITKGQVLDALKEAGPSKGSKAVTTGQAPGNKVS